MDLFTTTPADSAWADGKSRGERNNSPRKTRLACNRCHSQKLRCVKKQGEPSCERCLKLHTSCRFGPRAPRASLKPLQRNAEDNLHEPPSVSAAISMPNSNSNPAITNGNSSEWLFSPDIDASIIEEQVVTMPPDLCYPMPGDPADQHSFWPGPFCEQGNANPSGQYDSLDVINQDEFSDTFPSPDTSNDHRRVANDDHLVTCLSSPIRDLANLNIALYDCATKLPSMPEVAVDSARIASHGHGSRKTTIFAIDELLRLTSEFINIIKYLSRETCDTSAISSAKDSNPSSTHPLLIVTYNQQRSQTGPGATKIGPGRSFSQVDEGTMLMIMSCHCRLTEIYLSIFKMMQACIEHSAPPQPKDWAIVLPQLQVGSHASPPIQVDANTSLSSSTASMYMLMVMMLSSQLCEQLADVMRVATEEIRSGRAGAHSRGQGVGRGDEDPVSSSQCLFTTMVTDRTDRLGRTINATKHLLKRYSLITE